MTPRLGAYCLRISLSTNKQTKTILHLYDSQNDFMSLVILVIKYIKCEDDLEEKRGTRHILRIAIYQNTAFQNCNV